MSAYPTPVSSTPALTDEDTLNAALDWVATQIPLETQGVYSPQTFYHVLLWAASRQDTVEHACQVLTGVPSSNDVRYHLNQFEDMGELEAQANEALQGRVPEGIGNHRHRLAIDLHLILYYGVANEQEMPHIYRCQAKAGTTTFFAYATLYVIRRHQRVTLALHAIPRGETLVATVTILLARLSALRVKIKRLYLDRGFYSVPVIRWLQALRIPFLMPAIIRGKSGGTRALCQGRQSYRTHYSLKSSEYGSVECKMAVVCRYHKGRHHRHGIRYLVFVVYRVQVALSQLPLRYRNRVGIETSYRVKNLCRIRTTTKHPVVRFLYVALAFILVNLWIWLLWTRLVAHDQAGDGSIESTFHSKPCWSPSVMRLSDPFPSSRPCFCQTLVEVCDLLRLCKQPMGAFSWGARAGRLTSLRSEEKAEEVAIAVYKSRKVN